ncbi:MAG: aspartate carbamoyltransferase [Candidatus Staskawiczbacteria bacterium]|nr:aspartate carbamoyltransferase [Candidatus Staskawiczbacteria bacterium]
MIFKHILSANQFLDKNILVTIFKRTNRFEALDKKDKLPQPLKGKILSCLFYEPSTRTRFSFESAMLKLGGQVISAESAGQFSSASKGETLEDSIKVISGYTDIIVLRHPEIGSAQKASGVCNIPIINAGDGAGEHPTQALLDIYTVYKELGRFDNFKIAIAGDLLHSRTIHSLVQLLGACNNIEIFLISPKQLRLPQKYRVILKKNKVKVSQLDNFGSILPTIDILYTNRIQKERFASPKLYEKIKNSFVFDKKLLKKLKPTAAILNPLPRVNEISPEVDKDKRAAYFRQAKNGLYIRMVLLEILLKKSE